MNKFIFGFYAIAFLAFAATNAQLIVPRPIIAAAPVVPIYNSYLPYYRGFIYPSVIFGSNKNKANSGAPAPKLNSPFIPKSH